MVKNTMPSTMSAAQSQTKPTASFRLLMVLSAVCFVLLVVLMVASGTKPASATNNKSMLLTQQAKVTAANIELQASFVKPRIVFGQIESAQQSNLGFELSGSLQRVVVKEGALVKQNDLLATLDTARLNAQQNELLSALNRSKANAKLAALSAKRIKQLVANQLEPQQQFDEAQAQLDVANAAVAEVEARLASVEVELNKSRLLAPFDGQIVAQHIDEGTVLSAGQPIFSLLQSSGLEARFGLPEQTAFGVNLGQVFTISVGNLSLSAKVTSIAQQRSQATRTIEALLSVDTKGLTPMQKRMLVSGDLVSLQVDIPVTKQGAWVPNSALASGVRGMWTLYVINASNVIETRIVSIEYKDEQRAFISGAIEQGDTFVVSGVHRLTPHQQVENIEVVNMSASYEQ